MRTRFPHFPTPLLSLRTTVVLWLGTVFLAWAALVASWFVVSAWSVKSHHKALSTGIQGINASHRLETAVLGYRRIDLLWHTTGRFGAKGCITWSEHPQLRAPRRVPLTSPGHHRHLCL